MSVDKSSVLLPMLPGLFFHVLMQLWTGSNVWLPSTNCKAASKTGKGTGLSTLGNSYSMEISLSSKAMEQETWNERLVHFRQILLFGREGNVLTVGGLTLSFHQYKVYLFERILLCCKEINPNKQKKFPGKDKPTTERKGKRLQLKGRIFMQNVTEVISIQKPGKYYTHYSLIARMGG